jgi:ATP-dependent Clp protease ATP-binding subunit ClpA
MSPDLEVCLATAVADAHARGNEFVGVEHLMLALTFDDRVGETLFHAGADLTELKATLEQYLEEDVPGGSSTSSEPTMTLQLRRVLGGAAQYAMSAGEEVVETVHVLVAVLDEADSFAARAITVQPVSRLDVVSYLAHGESKRVPDARSGSAPGTRPERSSGEDDGAGPAPSGTPALEDFAQDLTERARAGLLDPLIGRDREIDRAVHILRRRSKNNPVFVGDPGVGKTAIVEGLALRVAEGRVPEALRDVRILRLDLGALVAGTRYRGDFEERLKGVLRALEEEPAAVLVIDEIHTVVGAGGTSAGTLDASNLLKPALESGRLRCIGATTWEEYRQHFERDRALARRFQRIEVTEPTVAETVRILDGLRPRYEAHHGLRYSRAALEAAAELAGRYLRDRKLPDKAVDLLDEAGAAASLQGRRRVGARDVESVLATMARVPPQQVRGGERERLRRLEDELRAVVFGQDDAIAKLASAIKMSRAGLRDSQRPIGAYLFTGPTGVGKTEVARQLALIMGVAFVRLDMSEYMERHSVSRLVGAPPGYVGYERGGLLTEAVSQSPHAVVLLDEIEKAHPDVFNILLQVMDHGTLTDTNGKETDFRQTILLMTSNVGARELAQRPIGFDERESIGADQSAYERVFSPEFRNRLDGRIAFRALSPEVMERIVDKYVGELRAQLVSRRVSVTLSDDARRLLARFGHDPAFGARPLARVMDAEVKRPLTEELLFGRLESGGTVVVDAEDGRIVLRYEAT